MRYCVPTSAGMTREVYVHSKPRSRTDQTNSSTSLSLIHYCAVLRIACFSAFRRARCTTLQTPSSTPTQCIFPIEMNCECLNACPVLWSVSDTMVSILVVCISRTRPSATTQLCKLEGSSKINSPEECSSMQEQFPYVILKDCTFLLLMCSLTGNMRCSWTA